MLPLRNLAHVLAAESGPLMSPNGPKLPGSGADTSWSREPTRSRLRPGSATSRPGLTTTASGTRRNPLQAPMKVAVAPPRRGPNKGGPAADGQRLSGVDDPDEDTLVESSDPAFKADLQQRGDVPTNVYRSARAHRPRRTRSGGAGEGARGPERGARQGIHPADPERLEDIGDVDL